MIAWAVTWALLVALAAAVVTYRLIIALMPILRRYAMARPNVRTVHTDPTPQGAGLAIVTCLVVAWVAVGLIGPGHGEIASPLAVLVAIVGLAAVGACDDVRPLPVGPRLALQFLATMLLVSALPESMRLLPILPATVESALLVFGLVWFINLTNFMDGIDWMTVVEFVPISLVLAILSLAGILPIAAGFAALALLGGLIGFAPHNQHVARVFLGDVGSLTIGGIVGWMLILVAGGGHLAAALLLPMYHVADATITLINRVRAGKSPAEPHMTHYYQQAYHKSMPVPAITDRVLALNIALGALALASVFLATWPLDILLVATGAGFTALVLRSFSGSGA